MAGGEAGQPGINRVERADGRGRGARPHRQRRDGAGRRLRDRDAGRRRLRRRRADSARPGARATATPAAGTRSSIDDGTRPSTSFGSTSVLSIARSTVSSHTAEPLLLTSLRPTMVPSGASRTSTLGERIAVDVAGEHDVRLDARLDATGVAGRGAGRARRRAGRRRFAGGTRLAQHPLQVGLADRRQSRFVLARLLGLRLLAAASSASSFLRAFSWPASSRGPPPARAARVPCASPVRASDPGDAARRGARARPVAPCRRPGARPPRAAPGLRARRAPGRSAPRRARWRRCRGAAVAAASPPVGAAARGRLRLGRGAGAVARGAATCATGDHSSATTPACSSIRQLTLQASATMSSAWATSARNSPERMAPGRAGGAKASCETARSMGWATSPRGYGPGELLTDRPTRSMSAFFSTFIDLDDAFVLDVAVGRDDDRRAGRAGLRLDHPGRDLVQAQRRRVLAVDAQPHRARRRRRRAR